MFSGGGVFETVSLSLMASFVAARRRDIHRVPSYLKTKNGAVLEWDLGPMHGQDFIKQFNMHTVVFVLRL